jgi:hypothetical protein
MAINRHGLSIGIERIESEFFLTLSAVGKLEHTDYEIIVPMIESALQGVKEPKIKVFFDASELDGWALRAAWDDLKLGFKHGGEFHKIAILGNKRWLELGAKVSNWFVTGKVQYFESKQSALNWLSVSDD